MNEKLLKIKQWIEVLRDIGLIIGIPTIIVIGVGLYERQIDVLKAENELLKQSQYDRAWKLIDSQKRLFENERDMLVSQIAEVEKTGQLKSDQIIHLKNRLGKVNEFINTPENMLLSGLLLTLLKEASSEKTSVDIKNKSGVNYSK